MAFIYKAKRVCAECRNEFISVEQSLVTTEEEYDPNDFLHQIYVPQKGESLANQETKTVECHHCYADNSIYYNSVIH